MANEARNPETGEPPQETTGGKIAQLKRLANWKRLLDVRVIAALLCLSVFINLGMFLFSGEEETNENLPREISLGQFRFVADPHEQTEIERADFQLHISLLDEVDALTRQRLDTHQFRVQQNVEELLRRAHGGDFEDPRLTELKRQLQEHINDTISVRGIAEVIVTDLAVERKRSLGATLPAETATMSLPGIDVDGQSLPGDDEL